MSRSIFVLEGKEGIAGAKCFNCGNRIPHPIVFMNKKDVENEIKKRDSMKNFKIVEFVEWSVDESIENPPPPPLKPPPPQHRLDDNYWKNKDSGK